MTRHVSDSSLKFLPAYAASDLLAKAAEVGADPGLILERAQIPISLSDLQTRAEPLTRRQFALLYRECILSLEAYANRKSGRLGMEVNETSILYECIINCRTLDAAIRKTMDFFEMLDRGIRVSLKVSGGIAQFTIRSGRDVKNAASFISELSGLSSFHQFYGWMIGNQIDLVAVEMSYDPAFEKHIFMDAFGIPVRLGAPVSGFRFSAELLDRPTIRTYAELEALLEVFPFDVMPPDYKTVKIAHHVRNIFSNAILGRARLPRIPELARTFGLSSTTLRRRLADEGTSINAIKASCLRELARDFMTNRNMTVQQSADRLGFSDASTFRRAFRRWYDTTPTGYRRG